MGKHKGKKQPSGKGPGRARRSAANKVGLRPSKSGQGWVLVHPRCVRERADDLDEVREMIRAGELEIAMDELRWLLDGCSDFIEAHQLLGEIAIELDNDLTLGRAHFGIGFQLGEKAIVKAKAPVRLAYREVANQSFFHCGQRLAACLQQQGHLDMATQVLRRLIEWDPSDPLCLKDMLDELGSGGLPIVKL